MRRLAAAAMVAFALAVFLTACGSAGPAPSPNPGGGAPPPVSNTPPQVKSVSASSAAAEVGTAVTLTAVVEDVETPVANLTYEWKADTGTFTGTGPVVSWIAGQDAKTPADVAFTVTVTERYTSAGAAAENKATGTTNLHLNNSPKELAELSLRFLGDFANSSVSPDLCVSEFSDSCRGKKDERDDIDDNRHDFLIIGSTLRHTSVELAGNRLTAKVHTFCSFTSKIITTQPRDENCQNGKCPLNSVGTAEGDCWTTNVYEKGRWWLCESHFTSKTTLLAPMMRAFFGMPRVEIP